MRATSATATVKARIGACGRVVVEGIVVYPSGAETLSASLVLPPPGARARGTLVLVHGFMSERREFADAPRALAERGWAVIAFDRRGHGASTGARARFTKAWAVEDIRATLDFATARAETPPPFGILGHSQGAALAAAAIPQMPELEAAVLAAPLRRLVDEIRTFGGERLYRFAANVSRVKARIGFGPLVVPYEVDYPELFKDPEAAKRAAAADFLQRKVNLADYDELYAIHGEEWAKLVRVPSLVLVGKHDAVVKNASSRKVFNALAGPKELVELDCGHSLFGDCRAAEAVDRVDAWFTRHLARARAPPAAG